MRKAEKNRQTSETSISITLDIDSAVKSEINSGVGFFDHMLDSMSRHGKFFISLKCSGDLHVDAHHSIEDIGICLGQAFREAAGDKRGISRFGEAQVPMDDALALSVIDISGRSYFKYTGTELRGYIGQYNEELTIEFFRALAVNFGINMHLRLIDGENRHHIHEAIFKSAGLALHRALSPALSGHREIPSTKGVL